MVAAVVLAGLLCVVIARVGGAAAERARADTAADAAALAAADQLALGHGSIAATAAARQVAHDNGAAFEECSCHGASAIVMVHIGHFRARARADVTNGAAFRAIPHTP